MIDIVPVVQVYNSWVCFPLFSGGIFTAQESITTFMNLCRLCNVRFVHWPLNLFLSSGIPQEWWIYQLVACPHLLKALFLALCPSHTLSRPLSRIRRMRRLQDKTQSSHQRATESNIQMTNCSQLNPTSISTRIHACIHTDIHTHACLCCVTSRGWHGDQKVVNQLSVGFKKHQTDRSRS